MQDLNIRVDGVSFCEPCIVGIEIWQSILTTSKGTWNMIFNY